MEALSALQLVVGLVLAWAGIGKVGSRRGADRAGRSALPRLVGEHRAITVYRATGVAELVIAAALLVPPFWSVEAAAAGILAAAFVAYLVDARHSAPESSCGCLGSAAVPVSNRSIARGLLLLGASGAMTFADGWTTAVRERPGLVTGVVIAGLAAVVSLSPELDRRWLFPLRRLRVRLMHPLAATPAHVPLDSTVQQLSRSPAYRAVGSAVRSDVLEHWDEGEWRFVTYACVLGDTAATAVFAVPLESADLDGVRVAVVDDATGDIVYRGGPVEVVAR